MASTQRDGFLGVSKAHSMVGKWLGWENTFEEWDNFIRWGVQEWGLMGPLRVS